MSHSFTLLIILLIALGSNKPNENSRPFGKLPAELQATDLPLNRRLPQVNDESEPKASPAENEQTVKDEAFKIEQLRQNRVIVRATVWIAVFSGLSFLAVVAYAITAYKQWKAIEKQANHASDTVGKMQEQLETIKEQARIMRESLDETRNIVTQNERAVAASETQASAAQLSVKAAERSGDIAQEAFYVGESAYFGISGMKISDILAGRSPLVIIIFINGGRTPAWHFVAEVSLSIGSEPQGESWKISYRPHISSSFFAAGKEKTLTFDQTSLVFNQEQLNAIFKDQKSRLFVFGSVHYTDVKAKPQTFDFCTVFDPFSGELHDYQPI